MSALVLNQSRNVRMSTSRRFASGARKWTFSFPMGPETTSIGPVLSSRHAPVLILVMPFLPRGYRDSCQVNFFFNDTATTEIYTLSLHDALPISPPAPENGPSLFRWK